jgi:hypothetical protein
VYPHLHAWLMRFHANRLTYNPQQAPWPIIRYTL